MTLGYLYVTSVTNRFEEKFIQKKDFERAYGEKVHDIIPLREHGGIHSTIYCWTVKFPEELLGCFKSFEEAEAYSKNIKGSYASPTHVKPIDVNFWSKPIL